jgi:transcriptional regulator with XRE-family HTH domain
MGAPRPKPERLAEKLRQIRDALGLSQSEMHKRLGVEDSIEFKRISDYELGYREPSLIILLQYARAANVILDVLADDELDLPERLPSPTRHEGVRRQQQTRAKRKQ